MTIAELQRDESLRRREFPVTEQSIFLAHAGVCPLPRRVAQAIEAYARESTRADQETLYRHSMMEQTRKLAGDLLGASAEEISFVGPTSLALSFVASGLPWHPGDNVVFYPEDYPSNVYPWSVLQERGVELRRIRPKFYGAIERSDVAALVDRRTRLVALASCHFIAGSRIDVNEIGAYLRERQVWFCLDAIQTLGAFPVLAGAVDFLAADAHKWLLGPCAAGLLYVRNPVQEHLRPTVIGWNNAPCPNFVAQERVVFRKGPRRYEPGSYNFLGLAGLHAALELILEMGIENIAADLLGKRARWSAALEGHGFAVLHSGATPDRASGIMSFYRPGMDMAAVHRRLELAGIVTSLRVDRAGNRYLRLSPHFYNTDEEFERCLAVIEGE